MKQTILKRMENQQANTLLKAYQRVKSTYEKKRQNALAKHDKTEYMYYDVKVDSYNECIELLKVTIED